jgi:uncharacterized cupredoxin-like copper-binding protein
MKRLIVFLILIFTGSSFAENVEFKPEKQTFKKGEKVCFYLKNKSNKTVFLPSSAPWVVLGDVKEYKLGEEREFKERVIYSPVANQVIVKVKPNEEKKWCWDQKTFEEAKEILSGEYTVRISVFEDGKLNFHSFKVKIEPDYSNAK